MSSNLIAPSIVPEKLYTSEEVAELLRISLRTVQRLLQAGSLKSFKIHGQYRIKGLDLLSYLDGVRHDSEALALTENRPADLLESLALAPVTVEVSEAWAQAIATSADDTSSDTEPHDFLSQLQALRKRISQELGFVLPGVRIHDLKTLEQGQYQILIQGQIVARGELTPKRDYCLQAASNTHPQKKPLERLSETYLPTEKSPTSLRRGGLAQTPRRHRQGLCPRNSLARRGFCHDRSPAQKPPGGA